MITITNIILYIFIFLIGITFGSFFTLAVYRIPLGQDITHTRSYCPNCKHKLSFWDMIPVFSYIFLGGKCRYCHQKIRIRYLLLEVLSGLTFVLIAISVKFDILNISTSMLIYLLVMYIYIALLFIMAGIDKEKIEIRNELILCLVILQTVYIIYLYIVENTSIYRYVIYLFILTVLIVLNNIYLAHKVKNNYTIECIILTMIFLMFTYEICTILTIEFTLLIIAIKTLISEISNKNKLIKNEKNKKIPIAFYLCTSNIIMLIVTNLLTFYVYK